MSLTVRQYVWGYFMPKVKESNSLYVYICISGAVSKVFGTQFYNIKYSSLIQIIFPQLYGFKYSYLIQIIFRQLYGFKYFYVMLLIYTRLYGFK